MSDTTQHALPPGWTWTTVGAITQHIEKVNPEDNPIKEFVYLDISAIDNSSQKIIAPKKYMGSNAPSRARQQVKSGDVLFSTVRTYLKNIAVVTDVFDGQIASTGFSVLRANEACADRYLFYWTLTEQLLDRLGELQRGSSYPAVRDGDVRGQAIPLAPLAEQRRIVAKIEELFTELDAGVASLKRAQIKLRRYKASVLKAACEGRLAPQDPADEPADVLLQRIRAERRAKWEADLRAKGKDPAKVKYVEPAPPDTRDLPALPRGWVWTNLATVADSLDNRRVPINKKEREKRNKKFPYYGANGQVGWIDEYLFDESLVLIVEDETFIGREKPFSYKITGKTWVNNHAHVLRPTCGIDVDYLNYSLAFYPFTPLTTGTTGRRKLTLAALMSAIYALPPLNEQRRIVAEIEQRLSVAVVADATLKANLIRAERLRQAILRRAFAGQLVPQDAEDEPAGELLERIRQTISNEELMV